MKRARRRQSGTASSAPLLQCLLASLFAVVLSSCATAPPADKVDNYWDGYSTAAISPGGKMLAVANRLVVVLFDIEQQRQVGWFWAKDDKGRGFRFPRDGLGDTLEFIDENHIVTTGMGGLATVWDIRTGQITHQIEPPDKGMRAISLAWSPATSELALGTSGGAIVTYELSADRLGDAGFLLTHVGRVNDLVFSADGRYLASAGDDKTVVIWDMQTRKQIGRHKAESQVSDLEAVRSRRSLVIAGKDVTLWKFLTEEEALALKEDKAVKEWLGTGALYALQAGLIFTGLAGGISIHDPANCGRFTAVSGDGGLMVDVKPGPMSNKITVLDVDRNEIIREVEVPNAICDVEFTEDGKRLVLAGDGGVFLVDTATWKVLPMNLIVDSFSRAPSVVLPKEGKMGLDVTGHRPGREAPLDDGAAEMEKTAPANGTD
jgi:WD40 repeat protein